MNKNEWSNVEGTAVVTFDDIPPTFLEPFGAREGDQLIITFLSSGSYTPASMYGGPDHLGWPAESDDERVVTKAVLHLEEEVELHPRDGRVVQVQAVEGVNEQGQEAAQPEEAIAE